jgi:hypothetical protein
MVPRKRTKSGGGGSKAKKQAPSPAPDWRKPGSEHLSDEDVEKLSGAVELGEESDAAILGAVQNGAGEWVLAYSYDALVDMAATDYTAQGFDGATAYEMARDSVCEPDQWPGAEDGRQPVILSEIAEGYEHHQAPSYRLLGRLWQ